MAITFAACNPTPAANVYLTGDSNWPATELSGTMHLFKENPYLTIIDTWPGLGVIKDDSYGDKFASNRVTATLNAAPVDLIVTNFGGNDATFTVAEFENEARFFLDSSSNIKVIWVKPAAVGPNALKIKEFGAVLDSLQQEYQNLWVVPYDELLSNIGYCPSLTNYTLTFKPVSSCYVNMNSDVHLNDDGRMVLATIVRVSSDMATGNEWRGNIFAKADEILALISSN